MTSKELAQAAHVREGYVRILVEQELLIAFDVEGTLLFDADYAARVIPLVGMRASVFQPLGRLAA